MLEIISIVISVFAIIVPFVADWRKYKEINTEFRNWRRQSRERRNAEDFVKRINPPHIFDAMAMRMSVLIHLFLISVIGSAVLSLFNAQKPAGMNDIIFAQVVYIFSSAIPVFVYLVLLREMGWANIIFMIFFSAAIGSIWSFITVVVFSFGASIFYSGIIAGVITVAIYALLMLFSKRKS